MEAFSFSDLVEPGEPIKVLARVSVLASEAGGKSRPFTKNYRPNHNFGAPENTQFYIGQVEVPEGAWVYPGETHDLEITFLRGPGLNELLQVGSVWRIQEGKQLVAKAQLLRRQGDA